MRPPILAGLTVMSLSALFISAFGAGGSPTLISLGMLGIGAGFAFAYPPTANAVANALPGEDGGAGLDIFQGPLAALIAGVITTRNTNRKPTTRARQ